MTDFAEAGDGQWPVPPTAEPLWRTLIHTAFCEEVAIKPEELTAWFQASGWDDRAASELTKRFYSEMEFLAEYEETRSRFAWR